MHLQQRGNAMIYILIAIALFGGLTLVLSRQNEQADSQNIDDELIEFQVSQILNYAAAAQGVVDQMRMSGSAFDSLDFVLPDAASYDLGSHIHKIYHPEGGGLGLKAASTDIFTGTDNDPDPGWYMGVFNTVEWTPSTATDIILTAHQIDQALCARINKNLTGSETIPAIAGTGVLADYLIDDTLHTGTNAAFDTAVCAACDGYPALCVSNTAGDMWSYYSIIEGR